MTDGHAESSAPESDGIRGLASFLEGSPSEEESNDEELAATEDSPDEDTESTEQDAQSEDTDQESDEDDTDEDDQPATERKIPIHVKGEDGKEETIEVTEEELVKGYHRQADYTRKMQALSQRENEAVQVLRAKHDEMRDYYVEQAAAARNVIAQLAGLQSDEEMAQLARTDPAAWVEAQERQKVVSQLLGSIDHQIHQTKSQRDAEQAQFMEQQKAAMSQAAWQVLEKEKIDKPKLLSIYQSASKHYGFTPQQLSNVYDPALVLALRDAAAYRELKAKTPQVTQKVKNAPRLPNKATIPANERKAKALDQRFKGGRAKLSDLAAYLR